MTFDYSFTIGVSSEFQNWLKENKFLPCGATFPLEWRRVNDGSSHPTKFEVIKVLPNVSENYTKKDGLNMTLGYFIVREYWAKDWSTTIKYAYYSYDMTTFKSFEEFLEKNKA
jgi:hypothetical protein